MPIEEKGWKELEEEYAKAKREKQSHTGGATRWSKCPRCQGSGKATCPSCKGLGRNLASAGRNAPCPICQGTGRANCPQPGCQGGWVIVKSS